MSSSCTIQVRWREEVQHHFSRLLLLLLLSLPFLRYSIRFFPRNAPPPSLVGDLSPPVFRMHRPACGTEESAYFGPSFPPSLSARHIFFSPFLTLRLPLPGRTKNRPFLSRTKNKDSPQQHGMPLDRCNASEPSIEKKFAFCHGLSPLLLEDRGYRVKGRCTALGEESQGEDSPTSVIRSEKVFKVALFCFKAFTPPYFCPYSGKGHDDVKTLLNSRIGRIMCV